ncbi:glycosyltransferase family 9 protein [Nonlabens sp. Asnod3-A02]|uniref:glycosyltransferase family 9 protein n=1 Tax=Nonlabens sp. Asnod3-A02 TaxID=3160579 RepID=UPI00386E1D66
MPLPQRILVIRLSAMGDIAMCVPVLLALKRDYPSVEIVALSRKRFRSILEHIPDITFIEADVDNRHKGVSGLYRFSKEIKALKIDAVADFHNVLRSKILRTFLRGIPKSKIDKGRAEKKKLINDPTFFKPLTHSTERYANVLRELGFKVELKGNEFLPKEAVLPQIHDQIGRKTSKWVGFAPFAAHETKAVTIKKAKKLVKAISQDDQITILLFGGGKKEQEQLQIIAGTTSNVINMAGITSFENELSVMSQLDAMIAMDSGNGHLAALYGVPVITLWGNTHPYAGFAPYAQPEENQLTANRDKFPLVPTSIFGNKVVKGYKKATSSIKVKQVVERLKIVLES